jgi:uncharacterized protein (DUF1684 family)
VSSAESVEKWRRKKDSFFKFSDDSPIPQRQRENFTGLKYFPPDEKYRMKLKLQRYPNPETITMVTSKGSQQRFFRVGYFEFEIDGKKVRLQAYRSADRADSHLFVPFRDKTSGKEAYGAARYIDLDFSEDDNYVIDFDMAYNPYCAYSDDYICPLPPRENSLDVEIRAGEKKYHI